MSQIVTGDEAVIRNLKDAGCDLAIIDQFTALQKAELIEAQIRLLSDHRNLLLQNIHADQRKLDCLDFLLYKIRHNSV